MDTRSLDLFNAAFSAADHEGYILALSDLSRTDIHLAGAKAANLGELTAAGFRVPEGFVVTTEAFERFLAENALGLESTPETAACAPLPPDIERAIRKASVSMGEAALAVRSSGVAEDLPGASYAGQYETLLDVRGSEAILAAIRQCWASSFHPRVKTYWASQGQSRPASMAVLIQRLVQADAAGVAFTANPVTGERGETIINAVRGLGERLVSGQATPDEWIVRGQEAAPLRRPEEAIRAEQALAISRLARRAEEHFGNPQDVEWAIAGGEIFMLQSRPMTALPPPVEWKAPGLPGVWLRSFRFGEWLGDPVTPLFESWLLTTLENRFNEDFRKNTGYPPPQAPHVIVNGWYFYGWNIPENPAVLLPMMLRYVLPKVLIQPRRASIVMPGTAHFGIELFIREWRDAVLPHYQEAVKRAERQVEAASPAELVELIDELADRAGDYFASIVKVSGFASKAEFALGNFYRPHLYPRIRGHYSRLLRGLYTPNMQKYPHAVESIDWFFPTLGERGALEIDDASAGARRAHLTADRLAAEAEARLALAGQPKLSARFERLLKMAQRFAPMREEQVSFFTIGWPVMRRAVLRLGDALVERGMLAEAAEVFFLKRQELLAALQDPQGNAFISTKFASLVAGRRQDWQRQRRLVPPLHLGILPAMVQGVFDSYDKALRSPGGSAKPVLRGAPASPGRATGPVRVIRGPEEFDRLQAGDILVAPATMPAWTPLFTLAAAVVTDTGGIAAHASIIAREYGIPAVVGTGDATVRLLEGQVVTVDGNSGLVEI